MTKITLGILVCTLTLFSGITEAEENKARLEDISKVVNAQLLGIKQKKEKEAPLPKKKTIQTNLQKNDLLRQQLKNTINLPTSP